ncbi:MAG: TIR domain-containing protein [Gemmatimonadaceae bacterium]
MAIDVFISYARKANEDEARALHAAFEAVGITAFLDEREIEIGQQFPVEIADALFESKVVIVFLSDLYFKRPFCRWEWEVALCAYKMALDNNLESAKQLDHIVVAICGDPAPQTLSALPENLRITNWPQATKIDDLVAETRRRLTKSPSSLSGKIDLLGGAGFSQVRKDRLLETKLQPLRIALGNTPHSPAVLPASIDDEFVGQAEILWQIDEVLENRRASGNSPGSNSVALVAMGGVGKSRIAIEYMHRRAIGRYDGGIFWINADVPLAQLDEQHHAILSALCEAAGKSIATLKEYRDKKSDLDLSQDLRKAIRELSTDNRIFVVVDNIPERPTSEAFDTELLIGSWPGFGVCDTIFTSRVKIGASYAGVHSLQVESLSDTDARMLMQSGVTATSNISQDAWTRVTNWVGNLPLVLSLLNKALRYGSVTAQELLEHADARVNPASDADEFEVALTGLVDPRWERGVATALSISFATLNEEEQLAALIISRLGSTSIPLAMIERRSDLFSRRTRAVLSQRSIVGIAQAERVASYGEMHRVFAAHLIRTRTRIQEEDLAKIVCGVVSNSMNVSNRDDPANWPYLNTCAAHAMHVVTTIPTYPSTAREVVKMCQDVGYLFWDKSSVNDAIVAERIAVDVASKYFGPSHSMTLSANAALAGSLFRVGNLDEARTILEEVLAKYEERLAADDERTLSTQNQLAAVYARQNDLDGAKKLLENVVSQRTRTLGSHHPLTLKAKANLARWIEESGDKSLGLKLYDELVHAATESLGSDHQLTLGFRSNLAESKLGLNLDIVNVRADLELVLEKQIEMLGNAHEEPFATMTILVIALRMCSAFRETETLARQALRYLSDGNQVDSSGVVWALKHHLAASLIGQNQFSDAANLLSETIREAQNAGDIDPALRYVLSIQLGEAQVGLNELTAAKNTLVNALERATTELGATHDVVREIHFRISQIQF